jgi:hypothetical protein
MDALERASMFDADELCSHLGAKWTFTKSRLALNAVARFVASSSTDSARITPDNKECFVLKLKRIEPKYPIRNRQVPGSSPGLGSRSCNLPPFNQFTFPFSVAAENSGTLGNNKPATFSTARFCDSGSACV